tara:strand:+ start:597 stop:1556 length:960 start_codon:yes stop_codon:yes gene_type:complete
MINKKNLYYLLLFFNLVFLEDKIVFESANPFTFKDIITSLDNLETQEVYGVLRFPDNFNVNFEYPLVVGVAGSLGWSEHNYEYMKMYRDMGIATFELKSFSSRDVTSTVGSQVEVTMASMVLDSYKALDVLSNHSNIDKNNIAITGWSLGGGVALFSGWNNLIVAINPNNSFAAHLPIYPPCFIKADFMDFTNAPIHILIGEKDDWTPALACEELVDSLNDKKENIDITVYENSYHGFDSDRPYTFVEHGYSFTDCRFTVREDGTPLMNFLNIPMTSPILQKIGLSFCISRGVTIEGNNSSKLKAHMFSTSFMREHLID